MNAVRIRSLASRRGVVARTALAVSLALPAVWAENAAAEVFGVFRGWVTAARHDADAPMPAGIAEDAPVVGCFRYWPEDVALLRRRETSPWYRYEFDSAEPRSMFAFSVGNHLWRSGGRFVVTVADDRVSPGGATETSDDFSIGYNTHSHPSEVPPAHPGWMEGGWAHAYVGFGSQTPPIDFLTSNALPDSAGDFNLPPNLFIAGGASSQTDESSWSFHFLVEPEDMVIRDGGAAFGALQEIAALCGDPQLARRRGKPSEGADDAS